MKIFFKKPNSKKDLSKTTERKKSVVVRNAVLITSVCTLISVPLGMGIGLGVSRSIEKTLNPQYQLGNKTYSNFSDIKKDVLNNSTVINVPNGESAKWVLKADLEGHEVNKSFENPEDLRKYIFDKYITSQKMVTGIDLKKENKVDVATGSVNLTDEEWTSVLEVDNLDDFDRSKLTTIFKKGNDGFDTDENKAYGSYFRVSDGYMFNDLFFNSKESLKTYLLNEYLPNANSRTFNSFVIQSPNGNTSNQISIDDHSDENLRYITDFITENSKTVVEYTSTSGENIILSKENYNNYLDDIDVKDLTYQHMFSNDGFSRYIVDNNAFNDSHNLYGPYMYKGTLDLASFNDTSMWKKVHNISGSEFNWSQMDSSIGSFFSMIINDDSVLTLHEMDNENKEFPVLFRTPLMANDKVGLDDFFMQELGKESPQLLKELIEANETLLKGKRYNSFFKIPILYSFIVERLISYKLSGRLLALVIEYFTRITKFIQNAIELVTLYDPELLVGKDGSIFDTTTFFQIGNPEYNTNTTPDHFLNRLKSNYPRLVGAITTFVGASTNLYLTSGLLPFSAYDQKTILRESKLLSEQEYNEIESSLENVYNLFSQTDYPEMIDILLNKSNNPYFDEIKQLPVAERETALDQLIFEGSEESVGTMLKAIGLKTTEYYQKASALLESELELFNATDLVIKDGYLNKIYDPTGKNDRLINFLLFLKENPNVEKFKAYMAVLIDVKTNSNYFQDSNNFRDEYQFGKTVARIVGSIFGAAVSTKQAIKGIWQSDSASLFSLKTRVVNERNQPIPSVDNHPIMSMMMEANTNPDNKFSGSTNVNSSNAFIAPLDRFVDVESTDKLINAVQSTRINTKDKVELLRKRQALVTELKVELAKRRGLPLVPSRDAKQEMLDRFGEDVLRWNEEWNSGRFLEVDFDRPSSSVGGNTSGGSDSGGSINDSFFDWDSEVARHGSDGGGSVGGGSGSRRASQRVSVSFSDGSYGLAALFSEPMTNSERSSRARFNVGSARGSVNTPEAKLHKIKWGGTSKFGKMKAPFKFIAKNIVPLLGVAFAGMEIFFLIFELLQTEQIQDFYQFVAPDGTQFIWDGGRSISQFFGTQVSEVDSFDGSKLLTPVQITLPQLEEFYYFNSLKYYDIRELKLNFVKNIINTNNADKYRNFKIGYTFDKLNGANQYNNVFSDIDDLVKFALDEMGIEFKDGVVDFTNLNKNSDYISTTSFAFSNGITTSSSNSFEVIAENIKENIRATKIVKLPKVVNGEVMDIDNQFLFPGKVWTNTGIQDNSHLAGDYLLDNSANALKIPSPNPVDGDLINKDMFETSDINEAEKKSADKLFTAFKSRFDLNKKTVLLDDTFKHNHFSEMASNFQLYQLYKVGTNRFGSRYFFDRYSAENFVLKNIVFEKEITIENKKIIKFLDLTFYSEKELDNWIKINCLIKNN